MSSSNSANAARATRIAMTSMAITVGPAALQRHDNPSGRHNDFVTVGYAVKR